VQCGLVACPSGVTPFEANASGAGRFWPSASSLVGHYNGMAPSLRGSQISSVTGEQAYGTRFNLMAGERACLIHVDQAVFSKRSSP